MTSLLISMVLLIDPGSVTPSPEQIQSDRSMMFEFRLGPMLPLIDRGFPADSKPYATIFGQGTRSLWMLLGELEWERQLFQRFGSLAVGFSVGYAEKYAPTLNADLTPSTDSTGLKVYPLQALVSYRWDYAAIRWNVPLVPYLKGGFVVEPWQILKGGKVESFQGLLGQGISYGLSFSGGLSLMLDFLDQRLARDFDTGLGVNHTYLFGEFVYQEVNTFGKARTLDLSNRHWMFGLALEF